MYDRPSNERGIVERLRCMASPEAPYAIDSKALAMAAADAIERLTRERDDRRHLTAGIIEEKDRLRAALERITECTEERDGGEGIVITGSSRDFWYAVIAAKELTHGRPLPRRQRAERVAPHRYRASGRASVLGRAEVGRRGIHGHERAT